MGFEITEEMVEAIVERKVDEAIDGSSVNDMILERINETVDKIVRDQVSGALEEKFEAIVESEAGALLDKEAIVDDGWGSRKRYDSYADFFVAELKERFNNYRIERTVKEVVEKKVKESINGRADSIINRVCEEILAEDGMPKIVRCEECAKLDTMRCHVKRALVADGQCDEGACVAPGGYCAWGEGKEPA